MVHLAMEQKAMGHDVDLFLLGGVRDKRGEALHAELRAASVNCIGATDRSARDLRNGLRLLWQIVTGRYDVVHAHLYSVELVLALLRPLLATVQAKPLLIRTLHNSNIFGTRSRLVAKILALSFDWNFACGRQVLINYILLFGKSKVSLIENGLRVAIAPEGSGVCTVREELGLPTDAFMVICIGAFRGSSLVTSQKAQDLAIRAFRLAFGNDPSAHLLLVGAGELRPEAEALAHKLGVEWNVHFLGSLANAQPILAASDLLFMPSRYEGLPIVALEAGCSGIPVLASSIAELVEVGTPYRWTYSKDNSVEDFASCLRAIRADRAPIRLHAESVRATFRNQFGIGRCAREYMSQIKALLEPASAAVSVGEKNA